MRFTSDRRRQATFAASMILAASIAAASAEAQRPRLPNTTPGRFRVVAPDLASQGRITLSHVYNGMGCSGQNISPALQWYNPPAGTRSYAVTAYDPDAPTGSGWWHWVMYNIPAGTTGLPAGAGNGKNAPRGSAQGQTDFGTKGYGGPCPPAGDRPHHYQFTVFALKVDRLDIPGNATAAYVGFNLNANKLGTARVNALYAR
jgi:Raf kinase inhibitor-like YbhB/YbcL family protein